MTNSEYVPFLINERSNALLHLIDAFQFTESELSDVYDGVFNRMKEHFAPNNTDKATTPDDVKAVREYVEELKAQSANQDYIEDDVDNIPENTEPILPLDGEIIPIPDVWNDTYAGTAINRANECVVYLDKDDYVDDFE